MKKNFYVYFLRRPDREDPFEPGRDQPFYVGKGSNGRLKGHRKEAKQLLKSERKTIKIKIIHKLWKQGLDFVEDIIFDDLTEQEAFLQECQFIASYGRLNNKTGCLANLTDGGEGQYGAVRSDEMKQRLREIRTGMTHTNETKTKMSESRKGKRLGEENPMYGKKHTKEFIEKLRQMNSGENNRMYGKKRIDTSEMNRNRINPNFGKPMSNEQKKLIGAANSGERNGMFNKKGKDHPAFGRVITEETREKMKQAKIGFITWNKGLKKNDPISHNPVV